MQRTLIRFLTTVITAAICLAAVGVGALAATVRIRGGEWRMPAKQDIRSLVVIVEPDPETGSYHLPGARRDDGALWC